MFAKSGVCTETLKCWTCSARMSPMKNLNPDVEERTKKWFTPTRAIIVRSLAACGMRLDAIMAVLTGLKTEEQLRILGLGLADLAEAKKRLPTPDEVMLGMLSIRRTGKFSLTAWAEPTGRNTTRKTRRRAG